MYLSYQCCKPLVSNITQVGPRQTLSSPAGKKGAVLQWRRQGPLGLLLLWELHKFYRLCLGRHMLPDVLDI